MEKRVLIIDDEKDIRDLLSDILEDEGIHTTAVGYAQTALDQIDQNSFDAVILDIWLKESHMDGIDILKHAKIHHPDMPVIIISGHGNIEIAVAAIKQGAFDFIEKPFHTEQLLVVIRRALELSELRQIRRQSKDGEEKNASHTFVGSSASMRQIRDQLDKLSKASSRVLFSGPKGSGKETAARYLHKKSNRAHKSFICVPASSLYEDDLEKTLFGEEDSGKIIQGAFERAQGGVVFIKDVDALPQSIQARILFSINEQKFRRVNGSVELPLDVRIFSSTAKDIRAAIEEKLFREDLFDRLSIVETFLPALNERLGDVEELVTHFNSKISAKEGRRPLHFDSSAIELFKSQNWHGNISELKNILERVIIMNPETEIIKDKDVLMSAAHESRETLGPEYSFLPLREARELFEARYLRSQVKRFYGNVSKTATFVGMERSALHRKMKTLNIHGHSAKKQPLN